MRTIVIVPTVYGAGCLVLSNNPNFTEAFSVLTGDPTAWGVFMPVSGLQGDFKSRGDFVEYADALLFARTLSTLNNLPVDDRCAGHVPEELLE